MSEFGFRKVASGLEKKYYTNEENKLVTEKILAEGGISLEGENITPIDLFTIPEGLDEVEKLTLIAKNLKIKEVDLEKRLPDISYYWREAKKFYQEFLVPSKKSQTAFPREIKNLEEFTNLHELTKTLSKATLLKKGDRLGFGPFYCALFSLMMAEREYSMEEFEGLLNESKYLAERLFQEDQQGVTHFHVLQQEDAEWSRVGIMVAQNAWMEARFSFRGKTKESMIMKLAKKPESSVEERIKDGIGLKFEVASEKEARQLFPFIAQFLKDNLNTRKVFFENVNLFEDNKNEDFLNELTKQKVTYINPEENGSSHKNFRTAKIEGEIEVPKNGKDGNMMIKRSFEVQVVLTDNQNESGLAQNKIYKRIQKLSLFSRLLGSFNEEYLDLICQEASEASGLSRIKIKNYIVDNYLLKLVSKSKKIKYVSKDQFYRWQKAKIISSKMKVKDKDVVK